MFSFDTDTKEIARLLGINPDPIAPSDGDILKPFGANQLPIPGAADAIALPTLVSVACDNLVIPLDMSVDQGKIPAETDFHTGTSVDSLTGIALAKSHEQLQQFANSPEFLSQMSVAFGDDFDVEAAQDLADSLTNGTFEIPPTRVVSGADINGANGAFAAETNNIYLASEFVAENADNPEAIVSVLLEEIGHHIDSQINISDTPGDEGAIFAGVVQGKEFDVAELQALKAEDDTATVMLDGKATVIEQDNTHITARKITVDHFNRIREDSVGGPDPGDYYTFTLPGTRNFTLTLNGLSANVNVDLRNYLNIPIRESKNGDTAPEAIIRSLNAGTYYVRVYPMSGANTNYNLNLTATPIISSFKGTSDGTVNIRSGPGDDNSIVGSLTLNQSLTFDAVARGTTHWDVREKRNDDRWFRVSGTNQWVSGAFITGNPLFNGTADTTLNIRSGPSKDHPRVGSISSGIRRTFDATTIGSSHWDPKEGKNENRWFRLQNTNNWVSAANITGNPTY
jgi:uncharacterized protein YraI